MKYLLLSLLLSLSIHARNPVDIKHFQAAKEHVLINFKVSSPKQLAESITNGILMQKPQNRPFKNEFIHFFEKIFTSDEYINSYARLYMKFYSIEELEYVNKVYSDPKMLSYLKKTPKIIEESMKLGQKIAQEHKEELNKTIAHRARILAP